MFYIIYNLTGFGKILFWFFQLFITSLFLDKESTKNSWANYLFEKFFNTYGIYIFCLMKFQVGHSKPILTTLREWNLTFFSYLSSKNFWFARYVSLKLSIFHKMDKFVKLWRHWCFGLLVYSVTMLSCMYIKVR